MITITIKVEGHSWLTFSLFSHSRASALPPLPITPTHSITPPIFSIRIKIKIMITIKVEGHSWLTA